jgi:hypothetical protein
MLGILTYGSGQHLFVVLKFDGSSHSICMLHAENYRVLCVDARTFYR